MKCTSRLLIVGCAALVVTYRVSGDNQLARGDRHVLAITASKQVMTWGDNSIGQLGYGPGGYIGSDTGGPIYDYSTIASNVVGMDQVRRVASGGYHSLALKEDGTVWVWGFNDCGQLGNGSALYPLYTNRPMQVAVLSEIVKITAGYEQSYALKSDGTVWAWGYNGKGSLGDGTTTWRSEPVQTIGLSDVMDIDSSYYHALAVNRDGAVWAWGDNDYGALGDGTTTTRTSPVQVFGISNVAAVAVGGGMCSYALRDDGTVWAWGYNAYGQLGDGTTTSSLTPIQVVGLSNVTAIGAGWAIKDDGTLWWWGVMYTDWTTYMTSLFPVQIGTDIVEVILGGAYVASVAVKKDGSVWAWGSGGYGSLGNGSSGAWSSDTVRVVGVTAMVEGSFAGGYVFNDYDGDGISDIVVQNETSGQWYFQLSSWGFYMTSLGQSGRVPVAGDFDGDGRSDPAVCDPAAGAFYILKSSDNSLTLITVTGGSGFTPIGGCDFNGDGITDPTLFDPASGKWYSTTEDTATTGITGSEPLWGDYDGDGQSDRAAYDPTSGQWFAGLSRMEEDLSFTWIPGCEGLNADFDGDNKADPALYHEVSGTWYVLLSDADYAYVTLPFGGSGFTPVPGDYDGDGKSDPAVYHEASGYWYRLLSASDYALDTLWFGAVGYKPVL